MEEYWHKVELFANKGEPVEPIVFEPQNEEEYMECYGNIINVLATASMQMMMEEPDDLHYAFIELPLTYKELED
jgi:hypothetical protein